MGFGIPPHKRHEYDRAGNKLPTSQTGQPSPEVREFPPKPELRTVRTVLRDLSISEDGDTMRGVICVERWEAAPDRYGDMPLEERLHWELLHTFKVTAHVAGMTIEHARMELMHAAHKKIAESLARVRFVNEYPEGWRK